MRVKQINEEVLYTADRIVKLERRDVELLKDRTAHNRRKRIRLCAHRDVDDELHEMFIANTRATYVRPHRNLKKSKSFHIIEGSVDVVMFDDVGNIIEVIQMGDYSSGLTFYYRMAEPGYHTLLIRSDFLVFVEATEGPFRRSDTVYAPWAPEESDSFAVKEFREQLTQAVEKFMGSS